MQSGHTTAAFASDLAVCPVMIGRAAQLDAVRQRLDSATGGRGQSSGPLTQDCRSVRVFERIKGRASPARAVRAGCAGASERCWLNCVGVRSGTVGTETVARPGDRGKACAVGDVANRTDAGAV